MSSFRGEEGFHVKKDYRGRKTAQFFHVSKHIPAHKGRTIAVITESEDYIMVTSCFQIKTFHKINIYGHYHFSQKNTLCYKNTERS